MSDNEDIVFTLKHGKGYEESWAVFRGDAATIRRSAMEFYGVEESDVAGYNASEVLEAIRLSVQGSGIAMPEGPKVKAAEIGSAEGSLPPAQTDDDLLAQVESAESREVVDALWRTNREKFDAKIVAAATKRVAELNGEESK